MLVGLEYIKTLVNGLKKRIENIPQSNWNQNDETAQDYIKNRICYTGTKEIDIAKNVSYVVHFVVGQTMTTHDEIPFEIGQIWTLEFGNGSFDNLEVKSGLGTLYVGDPTLIGMPFYITKTQTLYNSSWYDQYRPSDNSHLVGVSGLIHRTYIKQIDMQYIPNKIPEMTPDTAGKMLTNDGEKAEWGGAVRYDVAQQLTDDAKKVARTNIDAGVADKYLRNPSTEAICKAVIAAYKLPQTIVISDVIPGSSFLQYDTTVLYPPVSEYRGSGYIRYFGVAVVGKENRTTQYTAEAGMGGYKFWLGKDTALYYTKQELTSDQQTQARANIGLTPVAKTDAMTQPVGIDSDTGELYTQPSSDKSLGVTSATVGQILQVSEVDADGKPTKWDVLSTVEASLAEAVEGELVAQNTEVV